MLNIFKSDNIKIYNENLDVLNKSNFKEDIKYEALRYTMSQISCYGQEFREVRNTNQVKDKSC